MELCKKIRKIRNDNKLTQEQFAEKMLVSRTAVSKWENGTCYPSIDSLKYMSKIFNVSLDKLLSSEEILEIAEKLQILHHVVAGKSTNNVVVNNSQTQVI